jgi:hypothetical protein
LADGARRELKSGIKEKILIYWITRFLGNNLNGLTMPLTGNKRLDDFFQHQFSKYNLVLLMDNFPDRNPDRVDSGGTKGIEPLLTNPEEHRKLDEWRE